MFSLPAGTGMFRFPAFASPLGDDGFFSRRVAPFGLPRVNGHLHLAGVFRGLSRPSSPPGARASTARPRSLNSYILANASCPRGIVRGLFSLPLVLSYSLASSSLLLASRLIMSKNFNGYRHVAVTSPLARARDSRPGRFHVPPLEGTRHERLAPFFDRSSSSAGNEQQGEPLGSRKEVFQPHLPVRLPCYDLAPVTGITLARARERIHRAMADARLLANPASWSRVADSSPNYDRLWRFAPGRPVAAPCTGHCNTCVAPGVRAVLI